MEQTVEKNAAALVDGVTDIIKRYEARWQKTGEKYNSNTGAGFRSKPERGSALTLARGTELT